MSLVFHAVDAYYDQSHILKGIDFQVWPGAVTALLGRNGAGKTTTLKAVFGLARIGAGRILVDGTDLSGRRIDEIARLGIALVPEHRGIFASLSVAENLRIAARPNAAWSVARIYERFPMLARRAGIQGRHLSGGERQILAIARALVSGPKFLLIDEATQGLAPAMVAEVATVIEEIRQDGVGILLVDQNVELCLKLADHHVMIDQGAIVFDGDRAAFLAATELRERTLALSGALSGA